MSSSSLPERGVALMLAIFLTSFLFVLGLTMLYFIDRDTRAGLNLKRSQQAQAAAQSGLMYARQLIMNDNVYGTNTLGNAPGDFYALDATASCGFQVWREVLPPDDVIHSRGLIRDSDGKTLMRRDLAAPGFPESLIVENSWDVDL